jgi:hypothetical protein
MHATRPHQLVDTRTILVIPLMALAFSVGAIAGAAVGADVPASPGLSVPAGDRSYDALEETRANRGLSVPAGDRSYDALEETRGNRGLE